MVMGTLGKALGSYGAYVCASAEMIRYLINTARPLIYSTAPSPPAVAGALAALTLLRERPHRVQRLRSNARVLRRALAGEGFPVADVDMHIVPLIVGDEHVAMRLCQEALERGVFAQGIRPPTVPAGSSRLRLTAMASHTASELREGREGVRRRRPRDRPRPRVAGAGACRAPDGEHRARAGLRGATRGGARTRARGRVRATPFDLDVAEPGVASEAARTVRLRGELDSVRAA